MLSLNTFITLCGKRKQYLKWFRRNGSSVAILLFVQWQKKCTALKDEAVSSSEGCYGTLAGPSTDIHNQLNYGNIDNFENVYSHPLESYPSNGVLPMQYYTNECQVSYSGISGVGNAGLLNHNGNSSIPVETCSGVNSSELKDFGGITSCLLDFSFLFQNIFAIVLYKSFLNIGR